MPDYKEMYLIMARATEKAIRILTESQQRAEEIYISGQEPDLKLLTPSQDIKQKEKK